MLGVAVLNWYPKRKPSKETSSTTGCLSFELETGEEKNMQTKTMAAERETRVDITRPAKRGVRLVRVKRVWLMNECLDLYMYYNILYKFT